MRYLFFTRKFGILVSVKHQGGGGGGESIFRLEIRKIFPKNAVSYTMLLSVVRPKFNEISTNVNSPVF